MHQKMSSAGTVPGTENVHDVPNIRLIITPRHQYVRDGGQTVVK